MEPTEKMDVRPIFRRLAGGVGIVCLALAVIFAVAPAGEAARPAIYACVAVGVIMSGIGLTGRWPWWGRG